MAIEENHPFFHGGTTSTSIFSSPHTPTTLDVFLPLSVPVVPEVAAFPSPLYRPTKAPSFDSGLTCNDSNNNNNRKRCREYYDCSMPNDDSGDLSQRPRLLSSLLGTGAAVQIQHHQREFDCLVSLHTQRLRMELEERAKQRSKVLVAAVRETVAAALREKDEEISRLSKLNWVLQERIRSLCVENDLWRGLAQSNEAAANSLRTDLERVLTSPGIVEDRKPDDEDAESCCGSSDRASEDGGERDEVGSARRGCKGSCGGREEAGVMVMPCRHLCLCATCGSGSRQSCPICGSAITASVHVNFSSS